MVTYDKDTRAITTFSANAHATGTTTSNTASETAILIIDMSTSVACAPLKLLRRAESEDPRSRPTCMVRPYDLRSSKVPSLQRQGRKMERPPICIASCKLFISGVDDTGPMNNVKIYRYDDRLHKRMLIGHYLAEIGSDIQQDSWELWYAGVQES